MESSNIGCGALIYSKSTKRYLFLLRNQKRHAGSWGLVGGGVEINETPAEGLQREIAEEIGSIKFEKIIHKKILQDAVSICLNLTLEIIILS